MTVTASPDSAKPDSPTVRKAAGLTSQGYCPAQHQQRVRQGDGQVCGDQELLDCLYAGAASYVHGHSVGGTNPSLLRAMINGAPVVGFDCAYNRETTGGHALWFDTAGVHAGDLIEKGRGGPERGRRAVVEYRWGDVVAAYERALAG